MRYTIDEKICENQGLSVPELLAIMLLKYNISILEMPILYNKLQEKGAIVLQDGRYYLTYGYDDIFCKILLDAEKMMPKDEQLEELAIELMSIFPQGKKPGTNNYWRGNKKDIKLKLQKFFKLYGNSYTFDQIKQATKKYVESFNGSYGYMRILKYFIWKDIKKIDAEGKGYIEEVSDLASYIENEGNDEEHNWVELK